MMKQTVQLILAFACWGFFASATSAQDTNAPESVTPAPQSACIGTPYRDFDFWIGTWDVHTPDGTLAGRNQITSEEGGCLLVEHWTNTGGGTGQSYNFVDRDAGQWRQVWVSAGTTIDYSGGLDADGAMFLEGRIGYSPGSDTNSPFRGKWTLRDDGSVEQVFRQYSDKTEKWEPWFTGIYTKVETAE